MKNPNGFGGIRKLSGRRRKPYQATVTTGWEYVDGKAKQIQRSIGCYATRREALSALAEYNKDPSVFDAEKFTFTDLWEEYTKTFVGKADDTIRHKKSYYNNSKPLHNKKLASITPEDLQIIVSSKKTKGTQGQYITFYRDIFKFAQAFGYTRTNPSAYLKTTKTKESNLIQPFTFGEINSLPEDYLLFFYTGLRAKEMLNLTTKDILWDEKLLRIRGTKTDAAYRYIPIAPVLEPILRSRTDRIWTRHRSYDSLLKEVRKLTGGKHSTHDFRRTFATCLDRNGVDDVTIKRLMGHTMNDVTRDHYIKPDFKKERDAIESMDFSVLK